MGYERKHKGASGIIGFAASTLVSTLGLLQWYKTFPNVLEGAGRKGRGPGSRDPKIVTLDGKPAEVFLGDEQTYIVLTDSDQEAP